jgi:hypothetical protein
LAARFGVGPARAPNSATPGRTIGNATVVSVVSIIWAHKCAGHEVLKTQKCVGQYLSIWHLNWAYSIEEILMVVFTDILKDVNRDKCKIDT